MRKGLLAFVALAATSSQLLAQTAPTTMSVVVSERPVSEQPIVEFQPARSVNSYTVWGRGEYLLWWVKNPPIPVPLVTTGDPRVGFPNVNSAGALGQPGTRVLFGDSDPSLGAFSGIRFTLGAWLDCEQSVGVEGTGFLLQRRTGVFSAGSDALGNPPLYIPAFNPQAAAERALAVSDPRRNFSGDVSVASSLQLWGAEANGVFNVWRRSDLEFSLLAGFRYADLRESLQLSNSTSDLVFLNTTVLNDRFDTRNQFYGGQVGARLSWLRDRLSFDVTGKLALGATHQVVNVQGDITQTGPGAFAPGTFPGGLFTQPTNLGRRSSSDFSVLPSVQLNLGYQITSRLRAVAGYDFLYWSQVVRSGSQIDRNVNPSQSPIFGNGALAGPASPSPQFNRTDFWAHGVNFGLEFRY